MKHRLVARIGAGILTSFLVTPSIGEERSEEEDQVSPVLRIEPRVERRRRDRTPDVPSPAAIRSIDGAGNHETDTEMNAAETPLLRSVTSDYADGLYEMAGADRPSARLVSNRVVDQAESIATPLGTSDFLWQWGQFLDHDIDLTEGVDPPEPEPIAVPAGDAWFDPTGEGDVAIAFNRSIYDHTTGADAPRQQLNEITGWIDASNVYGSDAERARALRTLDGTGRLRTGPGGLLPDDDTDLPNATGGSSQTMFLAGDVRANEQVGLTAMHTLFVREHNRVADAIRARVPGLGGDQVYELARRFVASLMQAITYREFLPALLGPDAIAPYRGYDPDVDARIANVFSTAAYRFGHSALSPTFERLDRNLREVPAGPLALRDAFFSPDRIRDEGGIEPLLRGFAHQRHQRVDVRVVDDLRNFLFGAPGSGGFDLPALNIQRGRDHGLPSYAEVRVAYGFPPAADFADVSRDPEVQARLASAYDTVAAIDLWVGGLAEDPVPAGHLGPLFTRIIAEQFEALRDGDRFWYERDLSPVELSEVQRTRLSDVIRRNTSIGREIADDVFHVGRRRR
ncbi:MAG: peroxidase family protein [Myxococcota bacterium]